MYYENNGKWLPAGVRNETFFVKGQRSIREVVYETRNRPKWVHIPLGAVHDVARRTALSTTHDSKEN